MCRPATSKDCGLNVEREELERKALMHGRVRDEPSKKALST